LLRLLSTGLIELVERGVAQPLRAPYPVAWQRAQNQLAAECLERGQRPPGNVMEALAFCRRPLGTWGVSFDGAQELEGDALLDPDSDVPTELCRELAEGLQGPGAEAELNERCMARLRAAAEKVQRQDRYVFLRRYLIDHAVVNSRDRVMDRFQSELTGFGEVLDSLYEPVPEHALFRGEVRLCGHCGWTLTQRYSRRQCGDPRCRLLTREFSQGTRTLSVPPGLSLQRVRPAIRRYIVAPGVTEVRLYDELKALGLDVELWPGFDRYDLRITFPSGPHSTGETWALDVKDWRFPRLLARHLWLPERDGAPSWDRFFFVVPNQRTRQDPEYLPTLRDLTRDRGFEVLPVKDLVRRVQTRLRRARRADASLG
jgi:hypothetical protein